MVLYECFRCGYSTKLKGNMKHHLNRKNVCEVTEDNVEIEEIKKYYGFENNNIITPNHSKITPKNSISTPTMPLQKTPNHSILKIIRQRVNTV